MQDDSSVTDAEVVAEEAVQLPTSDDSNGGSVLINMESMIKSHISQIDTLRGELEQHSSMLKDIFDNDPTYKEHADIAKEAARVKSQTKQQILKQPQAADLDAKIKSFKSQIGELQDALVDYLREYQRMSGLTEIEGDDGEIREIVFTPKLIKKTAFHGRG